MPRTDPVSSLIRAAASLPSTLSDAEVAELIAKEAREKLTRWEELGIGGSGSRGGGSGSEDFERRPAIKPNTRFLSSVIQSVDGHNRALLERERQERRARDREREPDHERVKRQNRESSHQGLEDGPGRGLSPDKQHPSHSRNIYDLSRAASVISEGDSRSRGGHYRNRHGKEGQRDAGSSRDRDRSPISPTHTIRSDRGAAEQRARSSERGRERGHERERRRDRVRDRDRQRSASPDARTRDTERRKQRKEEKRRRERSPGDISDDRRDRHRHRDKARREKPCGQRPKVVAEDPSASFPETRSAPVSSKMDAVFAADYDPRTDLSALLPVPSDGLVPDIGWDSMLDVMKHRRSEKRSRKNRRDDDDDDDQRDESGDQDSKRTRRRESRAGNDASDPALALGRAPKMSRTREWDVGKVSPF